MDRPAGSSIAAIGWIDYLMILASLLVCVWIGLRKDKKKDKTEDKAGEADDFVTGGRNMGMIPVAFSMMATLMSGNAITGGIGEAYRFGLATNFVPFSGLITKVFVGYLIVPVFHYIKYVSIYEYIEKRLDRTFRIIFSVLYIISHLVYLGIALYGPSLSLTVVTGIPYWINVSCIGLVCAIYCVMGGLKAIIWTDVFQAGLMFFCVLTIIVKGTLDAGGIGVVFDKAFRQEGTMSIHVQLTEDPAFRYSLLAVLFSGVVETLRSAVVGQAGAQRLLCVDSAKTARKSLILSAVLMLVFKLLVSLAAMAVYANFYGCDPMKRPTETGVETEDQMFIYAVSQFVAHIPGLQGLALAGLISATLSTCSSFINAFSAITLEDFAKPYFPNWTKDDKAQLIICKLSTLVYAVLSVALSFATPYLGGAVKAFQGFISSLTGPLCGVMILALFFSKANLKALKIGFLASLVFVLWITTGNLIYDAKTIEMPKTLSNCPNESNPQYDIIDSWSPTNEQDHTSEYQTILKNNTFEYGNKQINMTTTVNNNTRENEEPTHLHQDFQNIFILYRISFMWYGPIGMTITCLLGVVLSYVLGLEPCKDERLLSPLVTKWFRRGPDHKTIPASYSQRMPEEEEEEINIVLLSNSKWPLNTTEGSV